MSDPVKYSLCIIARNCAENLDGLLESYGKFPDEVIVVNTAAAPSEAGFEETNAVAVKYGAKVFHHPWQNDFSDARNYSFELASHPWVMWLDTDDVVENPGDVDANVRFAIDTGSVNAIVMEYLYEFDKHGDCTLFLDRERVIKKDEFEWRAPVHEVLCAKSSLKATRLPPEIGRVLHTRRMEDSEGRDRSLRRNLSIMDEKFKDKSPDLRMLFYWGNTHLGLKENERAIKKYNEYLKLSDEVGNKNDGEKYVALWSASEAHRQLNRFKEAFDLAGEAILLKPELPSAYMHAAQALLGLQDYERVVTYASMCKERVGNAKKELVSSPKGLAGIPDLLIAQSHAMKGDWQKAMPHLDVARKFYPDVDEFAEIDKWCQSMARHHEDKTAFNHLIGRLWEERKFKAAHSLALNAPGNLADTGEVARLIPKKRPADRKSIAFICGDVGIGFTWGPWSLKSGIGGSEEAVINAAREFVREGWHVEVYCALGKKRAESPVIDEGVEYWPLHCWTGEFDNELDAIIWWRAPRAIEVVKHRSKLNYLWLHDIYVHGTWEKDTASAYDGVILLSDYHRKLHDFVPDDKVMLSENGIDPKLFVPIDGLTNEPHRMIWGSDPSRGVQYILPHWKRIREEVPDAELHIFYGWTPFFMAAAKLSQDSRAIYEYVEANRNQPGIHWHGKVGQETLNKEYAKSGIWGYPTTFPEIHCITAMKAQAHGCTPIVTDDFALSQTVKFGKKLPGPMTDPERIKNWVDEVIFQMKHSQSRGERLEMATWARTHTWAGVVRGWLGHFEKHLALKARTGTASLTLTPAN